jgi:hypothetical protein
MMCHDLWSKKAGDYLILNPRVVGSSPSRRTIRNGKDLRDKSLPFLAFVARRVSRFSLSGVITEAHKKSQKCWK